MGRGVLRKCVRATRDASRRLRVFNDGYWKREVSAPIASTTDSLGKDAYIHDALIVRSLKTLLST